MLITPTIIFFESFDAKNKFAVKFNYSGNVQILKNNLVIEDISNGEKIYDKEISTFLFQHIITENTLQNGKTYRVKIRVVDIDNNYSDFSNFYIFYCLSTPILKIENIIDKVVKSQSIILETSYIQEENELLQSFQYFLYNENKVLINAYPVKYNTDMINVNNKTILKQEITGLKNDEIYHVKVITRSVKGQVSDTDYINFKASYITPKINSTLELENIYKEGAVKLKIVGKRIQFKLLNIFGKPIENKYIEYINNEKINLNKEEYRMLTTDDTIEIPANNVIIQLWIEDVRENETICFLYSNYGFSYLEYKENRFHLFNKYDKSYITSHFVSNEIAISNKQISVYIRLENGMADIKAEVM